MELTRARQDKLASLIADGKEHEFYTWSEWAGVKGARAMTLEYDRHECQICKQKGRYSKAVIVHHIKHLRDRPDLAVKLFDGADRQLISLCKRCHEEQHPESMRKNAETEAHLTEERWD